LQNNIRLDCFTDLFGIHFDLFVIMIAC
jgi:hypothetical protein